MNVLYTESRERVGKIVNSEYCYRIQHQVGIIIIRPVC